MEGSIRQEQHHGKQSIILLDDERKDIDNFSFKVWDATGSHGPLGWERLELEEVWLLNIMIGDYSYYCTGKEDDS